MNTALTTWLKNLELLGDALQEYVLSSAALRRQCRPQFYSYFDSDVQSSLEVIILTIDQKLNGIRQLEETLRAGQIDLLVAIAFISY